MLRSGRDPRCRLFTGVKALRHLLCKLSGAFLLLNIVQRGVAICKTAINTLRYKRTVIAIAGLLVSLSVLLPVFQPNTALAVTSSNLNFQARLLTVGGNLVADGTYNVQFNLYTTASGGTTQWTESYLNSASQGVTVKSGYLSVNLGSITAFPATIDWSEEQWLGMTVRGTTSCAFGSCSPTDSEMTPRFKLTSVPYAFRAGQAANVSSSNTSTASTNSNAVSIRTGNATGATSNSGNLTVDVGTATQTAGTISIGNANASSIGIGRSGITTTITGGLTQLTGAVSLTGNAASSFTTSAGNLSLDSAAAVNLGSSTAT
ncbi:hypothetical protein EB077_06595, partial [bacterium]|nr:hypothetical protein [bacterium]